MAADLAARALHERAAANARRTALLASGTLVTLVAVLLVVNRAAGGGRAGAAVAVAAAAAAVAVAYRRGGDVVLAVSGARPADPVQHARLHNLVDGLCAAAGLPRPRLYVVDDPAPNSFAAGRDPRHAAVAVTTGMVAGLNRIELEGVLAHELIHVRSRDVSVATLAVTTVGLPALVCDLALRRAGRDRPGATAGGGPAAVAAVALLPLAVVSLRLVRLVVGTRREAMADLTGVALTRYPPGLVAALEKVGRQRPLVRTGARATAHLWLECPVARADEEGPVAWLGRLADTHPPLEERLEALREL